MPVRDRFPSSRMPSKPPRLWPDALLLTALFLLLAHLPLISNWFEYRRDLIAEGELWRLFTGHFTHLNLAHAVMNAVGLVLLSLLFERDVSRRHWWALILAAPVLVSAGLWLRQPGLQGYAGFSGVLHGLLYLGVVRMLPTAPKLASIILLLLVSRQVWEQTASYDADYLRHWIDGRVMPDAHLFGGLTGLLLGTFTLWQDHQGGRLGKGNPSGYSSESGPTPDA